MYAITGITGRVGGGVARTLLQSGARVRAVVRDAAKGESFAAQGAEVAIADTADAEALTRAFADVEGVFVMVPPNFAPEKGFPETRHLVATVKGALASARPAKVAVLSSIGAQHDRGLGLIEQLHILEGELGELPIPVAFVRPGWFMENHAGDVQAARETGEFPSYLLPLDRAVPMVATEDVGRTCGETLLTAWSGHRVVELEGPRRYSPDDLASAIGRALGRSVAAVAVPRDRWTEAFEAAGMPPGRTEYRSEMVDGFNSGWIDFEGDPLRGRVTLDEAVARMVEA